MNSAVRSALGEAALRGGHRGIAIGVATSIKARDDLIPDTSSGITTVGVIEMVAVTAKGIAKLGLAGILDGKTAGDDFKF